MSYKTLRISKVLLLHKVRWWWDDEGGKTRNHLGKPPAQNPHNTIISTVIVVESQSEAAEIELIFSSKQNPSKDLMTDSLGQGCQNSGIFSFQSQFLRPKFPNIKCMWMEVLCKVEEQILSIVV